MGTVGYLLLLLVAVVLSAQLLMLMGRRKPVDKHLLDLSEGGGSSLLLAVAFLLGGALGALLGNLFNHPGAGAGIGLTTAFLTWTTALIWAHKKPQPSPRHRDNHPDA